MDLTKVPKQIEARLPQAMTETPWTRTVAAGSLFASAFLLISGRRKAALAVAVAGAAVAVLEKPEAARELWEKVPGYIKAGQDFLVRAEEFVEDIAKKGEKFRSVLHR